MGALLLLAIAAYATLVYFDVVRGPFDPMLRGDVALARGERAGVRALFVGNSLTSSNSLPTLVRELGKTDEPPHAIFAVQYTAGGWRLRRAADDDGLRDLLDDVPWDVVVLQEQSQLLSLPAERRRHETHPYAHALHTRIARRGSRDVLFLTWGYRDGDKRNVPGDTFAAMQARLVAGYSELARELGTTVAPVGPAWAEALRRRPSLELWARDGRHPSLRGSYLAACVFYAVLSGEAPGRIAFTAGLPSAEARFLQRVAADVVRREVPSTTDVEN